MRKLIIIVSLWLSLAGGVFGAETWTLADGSSVSGDIVKTEDTGVMVHTIADTYTNLEWTRFSQDALKQLSNNPKFRAYVEPFIEPVASERPPKPQIQVQPVVRRMTLPEHPSILGGMFHSSLGLFMLLIVYAANLYAAYEVAVVRGKPLPLVMGLSVVLPIIGPIIFLIQPVQTTPSEEAPMEEAGTPGAPTATGAPADGATPGGAAPAPGHDDVQIVSASWQPSQEEKKPQPQVFSRGKFTLNKRFIETKFANYLGEPKGEAKNFTMTVKTLKGILTVECIKQVASNEAILETPTGQLTIALGDIQEIVLTPKPV